MREIKFREYGGFGTPQDNQHKPLYRYADWSIEVVGNIYENKELLKTEE